MPPYAGVAVRLQLELHREMVGLAGIAPLQLPHLLFNSQQFLYMVPDFVGNHICLRELSRRTKSFPQLVIESEIDVDLLILRTIKGSRSGFGAPTSGLGVIAEQYQL